MRLVTLMIFFCASCSTPPSTSAGAPPKLTEERIVTIQGATEIYAAVFAEDHTTAIVHGAFHVPQSPDPRDAIAAVNLKDGTIKRLITPHFPIKQGSLIGRLQLAAAGKVLVVSNANRLTHTRYVRLVDTTSGKLVRELPVQPWRSLSNGWEPAISSDGETLYLDLSPNERLALGISRSHSDWKGTGLRLLELPDRK